MKTKLLQNKRLTVFLAVAIFNIVVSGIILLKYSDTFPFYFFNNRKYIYDTFMDHFNMIRDAASGELYIQIGGFYPPLMMLYYIFLSKILPWDGVVNATLDERYEAIFSNSLLPLTYAVITFLSIIFLYYILRSKLSEKLGRTTVLLTGIICTFSYPVIFALERGNSALLAMLFSAIFVFFWEDENRRIRIFACICLLIAANLKLYPALFGLLVLKKKKFKTAGILVISGIISFLFFFVFYCRAIDVSIAETLPQVIANIFKFNESRSQITKFSGNHVNLANLTSYFPLMLLSDEVRMTLGTVLFVFAEISGLIGFFFCRERWQQVFCICYMILNVASLSLTYFLIFLILPVVFFLTDEYKQTKKEYVLSVLFAMLLTFIPMFYAAYYTKAQLYLALMGMFGDSPSPNKLLDCILLQLLFFIFIIPELTAFIKKFIQKRKLPEAGVRRESLD